MSRSRLTCGKEVESVLKTLVILELVISICLCLVYLVVGILIAFDPSPSVQMKQFLTYAGFDLENKKDNKIYGSPSYPLLVIGVSYIVTAALFLWLNIFLFYLICNGMKKKNYAKCRKWFIINVVLQILSAIYTILSTFFMRTLIVDTVIWISLAPLYFYLLLVSFIYLRDFECEVSGGTENDKSEAHEFL